MCRWPRAGRQSAAEALEGDGEVLQAERFAHEPNLKVIRIHSDFRRLIRDVLDGDDAVVGHGISFLLAVVWFCPTNAVSPGEKTGG